MRLDLLWAIQVGMQRNKFLKKLTNFFLAIFSKVYLSKHFWPILTLIILGLTPLLWYSHGEMALGHDMGYAINPLSWFERRLYTWNESRGMGEDQSILMAGVILHGFETLITFLLGNIVLAQKFTYIFWFTFPGISIYILLSYLLQKKDHYKFASLVGSVLYMFNLFVLQGWFIAERNKFAILGVIPLLLYFSLRVIKDNYSIFRASIICSILMMFFNGGGSLPLYGTLLIYFPLGIIIFTFYFGRSLKQIFRTGLFLALFAGFTFLANAFWILPQIILIRTSFSERLSDAGGIEGVKTWIDEISRNANYFDLIRMQGLPDWSSAHIYAGTYTTNFLFIAFSFLFILVSLVGLILVKNRYLKIFSLLFGFGLIFSVLMSAGSNGFFGRIYFFLVENVPLFIVFRTPFYKFGGGIVLAYTFLFSNGILQIILYLDKFFRKNKISQIKIKGFSLAKFFPNLNTSAWSTYFNNWLSFIKIILISILIIYIYPFLTGSFFDWNENYSTMVKIPNYVYDYAKYVDSAKFKTENSRILILPALGEGNGLDVTTWNFFSLDNIPNLASTKTHSHITTGTNSKDGENILLNTLYTEIKNGSNKNLILTLMEQLGIENILLRMDVGSIGSVKIDDPVELKEKLLKNNLFRLEKKFGEFELYEVNSDVNFATLNNNIKYLSTDTSQYKDLFNLGQINSEVESNYFLESGLSEIADFSNTGLGFSEVLVLKTKEASIENNKANYTVGARLENYDIYTKPLDISQLWYDLSIKKSALEYTLNIQRPKVNLEINSQTLQTTSRSQQISFNAKNEESIDRLVINGEVFTLPNAINENFTHFDFTQTANSQLSINYANSKKIVLDTFTLEDPSFEATLWKGLQVCGGIVSSKNVDLKRVADATNGDFSAEVSSFGPSTVCLIQDLKNLDRGSIYRFSFDYKNLEGYPLRYCILRRNEQADETGNKDAGCLKEATLPKASEWQTYTIEFVPSISEEHILHFYTEADSGIASVNRVDNVTFKKIKIHEIGAFVLDTGIEGSQFFNIEEQVYEKIGIAKLNSRNEIKMYTESGDLASSYIEDASFEKTLWGGVNFCGGDKDSTSLKVIKSNDSTDGQISLSLEAENGTACLYTSIKNFKPSLIYKVSFDYKNISGNPAQFCALARSSSGAGCLENIKLPKKNEWQTYQTILAPDKNINSIIPHLYSPAKLGESSVNLFDNFRIEVIYNPLEAVFLISDNSVLENNENNISYSKISPTNYSINVSGINTENILTLNTKYTPLWFLAKDTSKFSNAIWDIKVALKTLLIGSVPENFSHFKSNGLENSWVISEDGNYRSVYLPQIFFVMGGLVTIIYLVSVITFEIIFLNRKRLLKLLKNPRHYLAIKLDFGKKLKKTASKEKSLGSIRKKLFKLNFKWLGKLKK